MITLKKVQVAGTSLGLLMSQVSLAGLVTTPTAPLPASPSSTSNGSRVQHQTVQVYGSGAGPQSSPVQNSVAEDWKGKQEPAPFTLGAMTGLGVIDSTGGLAVLGTASMVIVKNGFVPDINNPVSLEIEMGPLFSAGATAFWYSAHLHWDFIKDDVWTFYAIGGLGGNRTPDKLGNHFEMFPRFGAGVLWNIYPNFALRAELSHEFMGVGVVFPL